jgi:hypothetical protein
MRLYFIPKKWLKYVTGKNKLVTDNSIQADHLNLQSYIQETVALNNIQGGTATISGAGDNRTASIAFDTPMSDTDYIVNLTLEVTGPLSVDVTDIQPYIVSLTANGFDIKLEAPGLGGGDSINVRWFAREATTGWTAS